MKECRKCGKTKEARRFTSNKNKKDGLNSWCRACYSANRYKGDTHPCPYCKEPIATRYHACICCKKALTEKGLKHCCRCNTTQKLDRFPIQRTSRDGRYGYCRTCTKIKNTARKYGITPGQYKALWWDQLGKCALCRDDIADLHTRGSDNPACVDHDHETGVVRGLLCRKCNSALGTLGDNVAGLERALAYLRGASLSEGR